MLVLLQLVHARHDRDGQIPSRLLPHDQQGLEAEPVQPEDRGGLDHCTGNVH